MRMCGRVLQEQSGNPQNRHSGSQVLAVESNYQLRAHQRQTRWTLRWFFHFDFG